MRTRDDAPSTSLPHSAAAATIAGRGVLAAHFSVNCLRPAQGEHFTARARVVKAGKTQVFTACELFGVVTQEETLVATGEALLSISQALPQASGQQKGSA